MTPVMKIITDELAYINASEQRSDKIRFDPSFIKEKKGLYLLMCILFVATLLLLAYSSLFNVPDVVLCVVGFLLLNGFFIFNIKPPYLLSDINKTLIKVCYTGEWYREVPVREACIQNILSATDVTQRQKDELTRLHQHKSAVYFEDLIKIDKLA